MKLRTVIFGLSLLVILIGCGVSQEDYDKLRAENEKLKIELDDCKFGAEKLIALVDKAYSEKRYSSAKQYINELYKRHPESPKNSEFKKLLKKIGKEELVEKKRKEAEEKERIRLANINNTGMWRVGHYVDDFGESTKQGYIRNTNLIRGTFSNTATQDSDLDVKFLISNSSDISIQLYEYAGNNPVKAYSSTGYWILIQDNDNNRYKFTVTNYTDRLSLSEINSKKIHNILMKGGTIKFKIIEIENPTSEYEFTIQKADYYNNAYRKLKES